VSYRGDFVERIHYVYEKDHKVDSSSIKKHRLTLDFNISLWRSPTVLEALQKTQYFRITMYAKSAESGVKDAFLFMKIFAVKIPQLRMYCGAKDRKVGETVDCTVVFNNPLGIKLTKPVVKLVHSGTGVKAEHIALKAQPKLQKTQSMNLAQAAQSGSKELGSQSQQFTSEWFSSKKNHELSSEVDIQSKGAESSSSSHHSEEQSESRQESKKDLDKVDKGTVVKMLKNVAVHVFQNVKLQVVGSTGQQSLMATLDCEELHNVRGQTDLVIHAAQGSESSSH